MFTVSALNPQLFGTALAELSHILNSRPAGVLSLPSRGLHHRRKKKETSQNEQSESELKELLEFLEASKLPKDLPAIELSSLQRQPTVLELEEKHVSKPTFFENKTGFSEGQMSAPNTERFIHDVIHLRLFQHLLGPSHNNTVKLQSRGFRTERGSSTGINRTSLSLKQQSGIIPRTDTESKYKQSIQSVFKNFYNTPEEKAKSQKESISVETIKRKAFKEGYNKGVNSKASTTTSGSTSSPFSLLNWTLRGAFYVALLCIVIFYARQYLVTVRQTFKISQDIETRFTDVIGLEEAKQDLMDVVNYLKYPEKFTRLGAKIPKGLLMDGPPGVGKTLLARAMAGEANVPFIYTSGSEFDEMFVGTGAKRIRNLFSTAKSREPCIIFIDELDSVGSRRTNSEISPYANQTINQLLAEMDGFEKSSRVIVIGATNRKEVLDPAILRPGRFDFHVTCEKPDLKARKDMLNYYLQKVTYADDIDVDKLARGTFGMSGAELENVVNSAALKAALEDLDEVSMTHLEYARDKILMGPEKKHRLPDEETNWNTAYHEAGHTIVSWYTEGATPLHKVTIIQRGKSLGHTSFLPDKEDMSRTRQQIIAHMDVCMGGRVAEELMFGFDKVTTGASSDFGQATRCAVDIVKQYGMSETLGVRVLTDESQLSPSLQQAVDKEIKTILHDSYQRAKTILINHAQEHKRLAEALMKYETLDKSQVQAILEGKSIDAPS